MVRLHELKPKLDTKTTSTKRNTTYFFIIITVQCCQCNYFYFTVIPTDLSLIYLHSFCLLSNMHQFGCHLRSSYDQKMLAKATVHSLRASIIWNCKLLQGISVSKWYFPCDSVRIHQFHVKGQFCNSVHEFRIAVTTGPYLSCLRWKWIAGRLDLQRFFLIVFLWLLLTSEAWSGVSVHSWRLKWLYLVFAVHPALFWEINLSTDLEGFTLLLRAGNASSKHMITTTELPVKQCGLIREYKYVYFNPLVPRYSYNHS